MSLATAPSRQPASADARAARPPPSPSPSPPRVDSFWSTPRTRTSSPAWTALMAAVEHVVPSSAAPPATPRPQTSATAAFRRPQCTHVSMVRAYGPFTCTMCGRVPDIGWVYACRQDHKPGQYDPLPDLNTVPAPIDNSDFFEATARIAQYLQMSSSIIHGIRAHHYTPAQVSKLIKQKQHLVSVINEVERKMSDSMSPFPEPSSSSLAGDSKADNASAAPTAPQQLAVPCNSSVAVASTPGNTPNSSVPTTSAKEEGVRHAEKPRIICNFQVCHSCRPYFQDRMYASFDTVMNGEVSQLDKDDLGRLPLIDPNVASTIGLRQVPAFLQGSFRSDPSGALTSQYIDDNFDDISVDWTPTSTGAESEFGQEHLDSPEQFPSHSPYQCPVWNRRLDCTYDAGLHDGRNSMSHGCLAAQYLDRLTPENSRSQLRHHLGSTTSTPGGASSTASSISLPTPVTTMLAPLLPTDDTFDVALQKQVHKIGKAKSMSSEFATGHSRIGLCPKRSNISFGSELEVEGGVALTEEAVEHSSPDILTIN